MGRVHPKRESRKGMVPFWLPSQGQPWRAWWGWTQHRGERLDGGKLYLRTNKNTFFWKSCETKNAWKEQKMTFFWGFWSNATLIMVNLWKVISEIITDFMIYLNENPHETDALGILLISDILTWCSWNFHFSGFPLFTSERFKDVNGVNVWFSRTRCLKVYWGWPKCYEKQCFFSNLSKAQSFGMAHEWWILKNGVLKVETILQGTHIPLCEMEHHRLKSAFKRGGGYVSSQEGMF